MANPAVVVDFVANTKDLSKGFDDASRKAGGFGSKIKGIGIAGAAAGFAALAGAVKIGAEEFAEAAKVGAQTDAVLKSTGQAANVTAGHVGDLAEALMKKSGVDDEAIQSGENLLLTFTNIRNEAGKGNDVFDQTTKAALDMSVAMGTDMKSASMQLGKALNDPVAGMTKLARSGVTFTEAQKEQVKALTASGKTLEAQKLILAEVNKEFGGSAEAAGKTLPGQLNILKQEFSNLAGELVGKLVPVLLAFANFATKHQGTVIALAAVIGTLATAFIAVTVATTAWAAIQAVATAATAVWTAAQWLLNAALLANPIGLVVIAIGALIAAFVLVYTQSETFRNIVTGAFNAVKAAAVAVFDWLKANWPLLLGILTGPFGLAIYVIATHWDAIKKTVGDALAWITGAVGTAWTAIRNAITGAFDAVKKKVTDVIAAIKTAWNAFVGWINKTATAALRAEIDGLAHIWDLISDRAKSVVGWVKDAFNDLVDWLKEFVGRVAALAERIANAIKKPINSVIDAWNNLEIPRVSIQIPSITVAGKTIGGGNIGFGPFPFPDIPRLAKGGIVNQPTVALLGEQGREIVAPEKLLRDIASERGGSIEVRVFIGDQELSQLVRTEIVDANTGLARTLLAGSK